MKLTIIIPAYNEGQTIVAVIKAVQKVKLSHLTKEIIVVNDGSTDQTKLKIQKAKLKNIKLINKPKNEGKGAAIRDAIKIATGDIFIIQDADLEYNPAEYPQVLGPILKKQADVVFGSRLVSSYPHRVLYFWHYMANFFLTLLVNIVSNINLTDMETCYKAFTKEVARKLTLTENRFGFEPEFTIKVAQAGWRIYEVGISYSGRSYSEGKKINWQDGIWALWCIFKYSIYD